jgi:predicted transcriptional regulator
MAEKDPRNPNNVKRGEVDDVFMATAGEVMYRKSKAKTSKHQPEAWQKAKLQRAQEIVDKANEKKKKGKS